MNKKYDLNTIKIVNRKDLYNWLIIIIFLTIYLVQIMTVGLKTKNISLMILFMLIVISCSATSFKETLIHNYNDGS